MRPTLISPSLAPSPERNQLLAALSTEARERIYPYVKFVPMPLSKVLFERGDKLRHVYFPMNSTVSLPYVLEDGASAENSVVGNEGLIGIALFMGGETTPSRAFVRSAAAAPALHAGTADADGADCRVQPTSLGGQAALSLAAAIPRLPG
jgi:hypothetical protein